MANETDGVFEGLDGALLFLLATSHSDEDTRVAAIWGEADFVHHDGNLQTGIFQFASEHGIDFVGDFFADPFVSMIGRSHSIVKVFYSIASLSTSRREKREILQDTKYNSR